LQFGPSGVHMEPIMNTTQLSEAQWQSLWDDLARIMDKIGAAVNRSPIKHTAATKALHLLSNRMVKTMNSLLILCEDAQHDFAFDGMTLLRTIYDLHLQALYILRDPKIREQRATMYFDFEWVEKDRFRRMIDSNPTAFARTLRTSAKRAAAEPVLDRELGRAGPQFRQRDGKEYRRTWYPGKLRDLAKAAGVEAEYQIVQPTLSAAVHSSPFAMRCGPMVEPRMMLLMSFHFLFRVVGQIAEMHGIQLTDEQRILIEHSNRSFYT